MATPAWNIPPNVRSSCSEIPPEIYHPCSVYYCHATTACDSADTDFRHPRRMRQSSFCGSKNQYHAIRYLRPHARAVQAANRAGRLRNAATGVASAAVAKTMIAPLARNSRQALAPPESDRKRPRSMTWRNLLCQALPVV